MTKIPKVPIGGIKIEHLSSLYEYGADGVAVVSAICGQPDVERAARLLSDKTVDVLSSMHGRAPTSKASGPGGVMTQAPIANARSIAGSDPSGGAGIQADLKSFSANHVFGMAVITALTAQNTRGVTDIHVPPVDFIKAQINAIFEDIS